MSRSSSPATTSSRASRSSAASATTASSDGPTSAPTSRPGGPAAPPRLSKDGRPLTQAAGIGAYAEQMLVHENALVKIRKDMPLDKAALISCGVITGVGAVLNRAKVAPASTVAVLGVGGVGMSVIQGARIAGARQIIAVDVVDYKLVRAREFGATDVVNASICRSLRAFS
jgi:S-(hydroxymethyl)glutathione dehydrogenase/alcohol dehydrogenase